MNAETVFVSGVVRAPDGGAERVVSHDMAAILRQLFQQRAFRRRQGKRFACG